MKTLLALEELIRSYNGISALDSFKALEALSVLKQLDIKYEGFGEDTEVLSEVLLKDYLGKTDKQVKTNHRKYIDFNPKKYSVISQSGNCVIELFDCDKSFYICDNQIRLIFEMLSDIFEFGEINDESSWKIYDSMMSTEVHDVSDTKNCVVSINYDENTCELLTRKNKFDWELNSSTEIVLNINTLYLAKVLKKLLLSYRSQEVVMFSLPESKKINFSKTLSEVLSSVRYYNVLAMIGGEKGRL